VAPGQSREIVVEFQCSSGIGRMERPSTQIIKLKSYIYEEICSNAQTVQGTLKLAVSNLMHVMRGTIKRMSSLICNFQESKISQASSNISVTQEFFKLLSSQMYLIRKLI